ncbi:MAG: RNA methyltransferase substrate-binding domain-containing protein, partial [Caldimonas sp.]
MARQVLFGFHAVGVRLRVAPKSVLELHIDATRRDARMRQVVERATAAGTRIVESDDGRLQALAATSRHQGVVARVELLPQSHSLDD